MSREPVSDKNGKIYFKIYALSEELTPFNVRYIGSTTLPLERRRRQHLKDSKRIIKATGENKDKSHKAKWVRKCIRENIKILIRQVDCSDSYDENMEIFWIKTYRKWGYNLTNTSDGGKAFFYGKRHTEATKEIIRRKNTGRIVSEETAKKTRGCNNGFATPILQYSKGGKFIKRFECINDAYKELGIFSSNIRSITCCAKKNKKKLYNGIVGRGKKYSANGFIWEYADSPHIPSKNPLTPSPTCDRIPTMNEKTIEEKRNERRKISGECFTPSYLTNAMLDKLEHYNKASFQNPATTFLDPACGNGGLILYVLKRKLSHGHNPIQALSTIYGVDIMSDNVQECRLRLLKLLQENNIKLTIEHIKILKRNIVCAPLNKYPNGSLDYLDLDEKDTFNDKMTDDQAKNALTKIIEGNRLSEVSIDDDPIPTTKEKIIKEVKVVKTIKKSQESKLAMVDSSEFGF